MAVIILAEDDAAMRQFLTVSLQRTGHTVRSYGDGLSAFDDLADLSLPADLLVTDIVMPGMDGLELAQRALRLRPALKVMYITGFGTVSASQLPSPDGHAQVLAKPLHLSQFLSEIERQLTITIT